MAKKRRMTKDEKINLALKFAMILMFLIGVGIFSYPFVVDSLNNYIDQQRIESYQAELQAKNKAKAAELKKKMAEKNKEIANGTSIPGMGVVADPFDEAVGNNADPGKEYFADHTVGAIYIPAIRVSLPIFDETNDVLLDKGATILQGSSFPIGGQDTHAVITSHTGLPDKKLFTDLIDLKKNDLFYIDVLNEKLAYKVVQIKVVLPTELDSLVIQKGRDLVTLITCTPYMVNSHRLLVTGERTAYIADRAEKEIKKTKEHHKRRLVEYIVAIVVGLSLFFYWVWRKSVLVRSRKKTYDLRFRITAHDQPVDGVVFQLLDHRGRPLKGMDDITQTAISDSKEQVIFPQIPGNIYHVAAVDEPAAWPKIKGKVRLLKDPQFKLRVKRKYLTKTGKKPTIEYQIKSLERSS